jgi:hypothetical protein
MIIVLYQRVEPTVGSERSPIPTQMSGAISAKRVVAGGYKGMNCNATER